MLAADNDAPAVVAEITADPKLKAAAIAMLPSLEARASACGAEAVVLTLTPLLTVYGGGARAETTAFWSVYRKALADLPAEALSAAVDAYTRLPTSDHFPKPGPLRELALQAGRPLLTALGRARQVSRAEPAKTVHRPTVEERRAAVEEIRRTIGHRRPADAPAARAAPERPMQPWARDLLAQGLGRREVGAWPGE